MVNLRINLKGVASILMAGGISLSAYGLAGKVVQENTKEVAPKVATEVVLETPEPILQVLYEKPEEISVSDDKIVDSIRYNQIDGDGDFILKEDAKVFYISADDKINDIDSAKKEAMYGDGEKHLYIYIKFLDGSEGYTEAQNLILNDKLDSTSFEVITENKEASLTQGTFIYNKQGEVINYGYRHLLCTRVAKNDKYTLVIINNNGTEGFVLNDCLTNHYFDALKFGLVDAKVNIYYDESLTKVAYTTSVDEVMNFQFINDACAGFYDKNGSDRIMYVSAKDVAKNFVDISETDQRMYCYLNYKYVVSWPTRSGKALTPTHNGAYDIDWMAKNWEFKNYPGTYADNWIAINEYEEGVHDYVGDDEFNYGDDLYITDGSHGCVRTTAAGSKFIEDNYVAGDMIAIRKNK